MEILRKSCLVRKSLKLKIGDILLMPVYAF